MNWFTRHVYKTYSFKLNRRKRVVSTISFFRVINVLYYACKLNNHNMTAVVRYHKLINDAFFLVNIKAYVQTYFYKI